MPSNTDDNSYLSGLDQLTNTLGNFLNKGAEAYSTVLGAKYIKNINGVNKKTVPDLIGNTDNTVTAVGIASYAIAAISVVGIGILIWKELK